MEQSVITEQATPKQQPWSLRVWRTVIWFAVALMLALMVVGLLKAFSTPPDGGRTAPDFSLTLYQNSEPFNLSDYKGEVVVINFWASWCAPCASEAPALEAAWQKYQHQGVQFVGVDYVDAEDKALEYITKYGITYANGPDLRTEISDLYRIRGVPETFIVDRNGKVVFYAPREITYDELAAEIESAMAIPVE
jgi:cytochrome c biogenesis protein CcmG, thiol:disulfide interchange protein DsbE